MSGDLKMQVTILVLVVLLGFGVGVAGGTLLLTKTLKHRAAARLARGYQVHT